MQKTSKTMKGGMRPLRLRVWGYVFFSFLFSFLYSGAQNLIFGLNCCTISCYTSENLLIRHLFLFFSLISFFDFCHFLNVFIFLLFLMFFVFGCVFSISTLFLIAFLFIFIFSSFFLLAFLFLSFFCFQQRFFTFGQVELPMRLGMESKENGRSRT